MVLDRRWMAGLATVALATAGVAACGGSEAKEPGQGGEGAGERPVRMVNVEIEEAAAVPFTDVVGIIGVVAPNRNVTVAAEEGGVIRTLYVEKGESVAAGQPIAKIDDALLQAQLRQAIADAELARETFERQRRLWEEEKIGTELAYLQAKYAAERAAANAAVLMERVDRTTIRAPIAGVLDDRMVEVGSMVSPGAPVARVVDASTLKIEGGVPERFALEVRPGARARVTFDGLDRREVEGRIAFVGAVVDERARTFPIEVSLQNPGRVKPGMVANIGIEYRTLDSAVVVPQEAVLRAAEGYIAYVAVERGGEAVAEARPVVTGPARRGRVVIESGIEPGEAVVVVGQHQVAPGDRLRIVARRNGGAR